MLTGRRSTCPVFQQVSLRSIILFLCWLLMLSLLDLKKDTCSCKCFKPLQLFPSSSKSYFYPSKIIFWMSLDCQAQNRTISKFSADFPHYTTDALTPCVNRTAGLQKSAEYTWQVPTNLSELCFLYEQFQTLVFKIHNRYTVGCHKDGHLVTGLWVSSGVQWHTSWYRKETWKDG